jgi:hypothetical protein
MNRGARFLWSRRISPPATPRPVQHLSFEERMAMDAKRRHGRSCDGRPRKAGSRRWRAHVPDGKPPHVVKLAGGPYDRNQSLLLIESIYTEIGKKFGTDESKRGMQGVIAN